MRTDRSYRKALSPEAALAELEANSGQQFDPDLVRALLRIVEPPAKPRPAVKIAVDVIEERDLAAHAFATSDSPPG